MHSARPNLFTRDDTFLGVCEGLGEDLGIHANWLRVALGLLIFWYPLAVIGAYLAMGAAVALSRWLYPSPRPAGAAAARGAEADGQPEAEPEPMPLAA